MLRPLHSNPGHKGSDISFQDLVERRRRIRELYCDIKEDAGPTAASKPGSDSDRTLSDSSTSAGAQGQYPVGASVVHNASQTIKSSQMHPGLALKETQGYLRHE